MYPTHYISKKALSFLFSFSILFTVAVTSPCIAHEGHSHHEEENLTHDLIETIDNQLKAIREDNLESAYYRYTSDEFQKATRLAEFKKFINNTPAFKEFLTVAYGEGEKENDKATISIALFTEENRQPVDYTLVQEDGEWKIWSVNPEGYENEEPIAMEVDQSEQHDLTKTIEDHLNKIKQNDVEGAYKEQLAKEFMKTTPLDKYEEFVKTQPEFTQYTSIKINEIKTEGNLKVVPVVFTSSQGESEVVYYLAKEDGHWKIWGIHVVRSPSSPLTNEQEKKELLGVIHQQFDALKENDFSQAYYSLTSDDFKKAVSFETFKDFIHAYPIFLKHDKVDTIDVFTEGNLRLVRLALSSKNEIAEFDYRLIKEDNQWKIWGIQIFTETLITEAPKNKEEIVTVIQKQLDALRSGDFSNAYYAFTAKEFQEVSSREDFKKFLEEHPEIGKNKSVKINQIDFTQNLATADVELTSEDNQTKRAEYRLVYNENGWKILSIQFFEETISLEQPVVDTSVSNAKTDIVKADMGTQINLQGLVTNPSTVFKTDEKEITMNFHVKDGKKGEVIEVIVEHVESHSQIPAVKVTLTQNGDSIINFIITPPTQGWPLGNYKIYVTTDQGVQKIFTFQVES